MARAGHGRCLVDRILDRRGDARWGSGPRRREIAEYYSYSIGGGRSAEPGARIESAERG